MTTKKEATVPVDAEQTPDEAADAKALPKEPGSTDGLDNDGNARPHVQGENPSADHREIEEPAATRAATDPNTSVPNDEAPTPDTTSHTGTSKEAKAAEAKAKEAGQRGYYNRRSVFDKSTDDEKRAGEVEGQKESIDTIERSYLTITSEQNYYDVAGTIGLRAVPDGVAIARLNGVHGSNFALTKGDVVVLPDDYTYEGIKHVKKKKLS